MALSGPAENERQARIALERLIEQIEAGEYRDGLGQRLTLNTAFIEARTLLEVQELLERQA